MGKDKNMKINIKKIIKSINSVKILACVFMLFTIYVGIEAFPVVLVELSNMTKSGGHDFVDIRDNLDKSYANMLSTEINKPALRNAGTYINLNGLMAHMLGQRYVNERIKLDNGQLTTLVESVNTNLASERMTTFFLQQKERNKHFLFVVAPNMISKYDSGIPVGYQNFSNDNTDSLVSSLSKNNVPILDLREKMHEQGISHSEAFYKTDHHWKTETGLWAYTEIVQSLTEMGAIPKVDSSYTNVDNFESRLYKDWFLGSSGKRTGRYYAGLDDFQLIIPKFETNMTLEIPTSKISNSGKFEDVALNMKMLNKKDYFNANPYSVYGYAERDLSHWWNEYAPVNQKVLMIGDSFGNVPFAFLPLVISTCDEMDMRYFKEDFESYYDEFEPDIVIFLINATSPSADNTTYDFFPTK